MPQFSQPIQNVPPGTHTIPAGAGPGATVVFTCAADAAPVDVAVDVAAEAVGCPACGSGSDVQAAQAVRTTASTIDMLVDIEAEAVISG
jgi:hypothetical protein